MTKHMSRSHTIQLAASTILLFFLFLTFVHSIPGLLFFLLVVGAFVWLTKQHFHYGLIFVSGLWVLSIILNTRV